MNTPKIIRGIPEPQADGKWVGIDTEIFQMDRNKLHRPTTGKFGCLTIATDENTVYFIDKEEMVQPALDAIQNCTWAFSNAKFDLTQLRRWANIPPRKRLYDTQVLEQIMFSGYYSSFSLKSLCRRYLGEVIEKETRDEFSTKSEFTQEMVEYSVHDPIYTLRCAKEQRKILTPQDIKVWTDIDRPALWAFLDFKGMPIDNMGWLSLSEKNKKRADDLRTQFDFNVNAPAQVLVYLKKNGFKKLVDTNNETLTEAIEKCPDCKAADAAKTILEIRTYAKRASTYGELFLLEHAEYDAQWNTYIYANYNLIGAETGRTSSDSPNMQNIPSRDTKEFRELFRAIPGYSIIILDFSSQEPRLTSITYHDERMLQWFREGKDIYIEAAKLIFEKELTKKSPERQQMKSTVLGLTYGMSKYGLAHKEGITVKEAEKLIDKTLRLFPGLAKGMEKQRKETTKVITPFGRTIWLNPYSSQAERNALNGPIQGGAADSMKAALGRIHQEWPSKFGEFGVVAYVHDEIVLHVPTDVANDVAEFAQHAMEDQASKMVDYIIPFPVDKKIAQSWAEK